MGHPLGKAFSQKPPAHLANLGNGEWRTDFPPPPGFDGQEQGEWDEEGCWRGLTDDEHAALIRAGIAETEGSVVTIEQDEAERDAFFAGLAVGPHAESDCQT